MKRLVLELPAAWATTAEKLWPGAIVSLVVVFPALPVTAITCLPQRLRAQRAIDCSAARVSFTTSAFRPPDTP